MACGPADKGCVKREKLPTVVLRHALAARAFQTGLQADTDRLKDVVNALAEHVNLIRHPSPALKEKLDAAEESCRHLKTLDDLHSAWRETFADLRRSVRRLRFNLRRIAALKRNRGEG